jgi:hypothetical protein
VVIHIEGWVAKDVSPIVFGFLTKTAWTFFSIESMMARHGEPVIVEKFDDIHLTIL